MNLTVTEIIIDTQAGLWEQVTRTTHNETFYANCQRAQENELITRKQGEVGRVLYCLHHALDSNDVTGLL